MLKIFFERENPNSSTSMYIKEIVVDWDFHLHLSQCGWYLDYSKFKIPFEEMSPCE
jgi:hypothetical protein